jgi:hypothetical protein
MRERTKRSSIQRALTIALFALDAATGCRGTSKSERAGPTNTGDAGRAPAGSVGQAGSTAATGGINEPGERAGSGGAPSEASAGTSTGDITSGGRAAATAGATFAETSGGGASGGSAAGSGGGSAGEPSDSAGESAGGAGGAATCEDLCTTSAPACCTSELRCVSTESHCRIDVLVGHLNLSYTYADLEQRIAALSGDVLLSLTDADIELAAAEPAPAARFEFALNADASVAYGAMLEGALGQGFRVSCDDEPLFVGVIYFKDGQAALQTPVIHVERTGESAIVLELGAEEGAWTGTEALSVDDSERARIDRPELRAAFCERGKLEVLD